MQSRKMSLIEAITNNIVAFGISVLLSLYLFPLFGFQVKVSESMVIVAVFSVVSIIRSYLMRRLFNAIK